MEPKSNGRAQSRAGAEPSSYSVKVSQRFIVLSLVSSILVAFAVGRTARVILIDRPYRETLLVQQAFLAASQNRNTGIIDLPNPTLQEGKIAPKTIYTSKNFDSTKSNRVTSRWIVSETGGSGIDVSGTDEGTCGAGEVPGRCSAKSGAADGSLFVDEEDHFPAGQHLLLDYENVQSAFLDSEERLVTAMLTLVNLCGLTLLSYHCHSLEPSGVSCAGVLLESHVSFHTWPGDGVITLDLYTCGPDSLLPILPVAEKLFKIKETPSYAGEKLPDPEMVWLYKLRGFRENDDVADITDLMHYPIGSRLDYKKEIAAVQTPFQQIDVYDVLRPDQEKMLDHYRKSISNDGSYESLHPEFYELDRIVYLDGVMQSRRSGDAPYHEALVHPAMFTHVNPKRVAIIGGGEGATLREVLKHKTVEKVVMIEIDEVMVKASREFLPDWNDCSNLEGSRPNCFDDPRAEIYFEDAFKWFIDRFSDGGELKGTEEPFDVIIMDALDPQVQKDFVQALYDGSDFLKSLPGSLSDDGILITQVGIGPHLMASSEDHSIHKNRVRFFETLVEIGFGSVRDYSEGHCGFDYPWEYVIAFKNVGTKVDWFANEAAVAAKMQRRSVPTLSGEPPFVYFDGATMVSYQYPTKNSEVVFCRRQPMPDGCEVGHGFDLDRVNIPIDALEVKKSTLGENVGRGVFATMDIPKLSYVGLEKLVQIVYIDPSAYALIRSWDNHMSNDYKGETLKRYATAYGHSFSNQGGIDVYSDATIHTFINHGCDGSNNIGHDLSVTEADAPTDSIPEEIMDKVRGARYIYNPANERNVRFFSSAVPRRDIVTGEELLDNYLGMFGLGVHEWGMKVKGLRKQCSGELGDVRRYELNLDEAEGE